MPAEWPPHMVDVDTRLTREVVPDAVRDDMQLVAAPGEVARQREIGDVHAAERREIAGDQEPRRHLRNR